MFHALPASMEAADDGLVLVVDDALAVGEVTVDPLVTTEAWSVESNQVDAHLGGSTPRETSTPTATATSS